MLGDASNDLSNSYGVLGMAPGAQWVGCRNMRNNYGNPASYAACFQFMLAPYPQNGDPFTDGRPALAPHIINNSWSCPPTEDCDSDSLRQVVETARAAGQLVVASAGNYGPACSSVQHPIAIHDAVFSVGAHNSAGQIAGFSSRGPVIADGSGRLKPDISAPGVDVFSATSRSGYGYASGTSMSSPHVAGAAALLWSAAPDLIGNIDLTEQVLIKSATRVLDNQCLSGSAPVSPNPAYGYGRLDALSAVMMARTPWEVVVNVTNSQGAAQADVRVVLIDELTRYRFVNATNKNGVVRLPRVYDGGYTLRVGSGDQVVVKKDVELQAAGNPDAIGRSRHIDVTYPVSVSIEQLYLPRLSFQ